MAYYSGWPEIKRKSLFHALNQKAAPGKAAESLGKSYQESRLLVTHLGGGITVGVHKYGRVVEERILAGDSYAAEVFEAMAYQVAKEIGAGAAVLEGRVDAIVLTGGLANSERFTGWIRQRVAFIAPVIVFAGEFEMEALASGAWRVISGREEARIYAPTEDWSHYVGFN